MSSDPSASLSALQQCKVCSDPGKGLLNHLGPRQETECSLILLSPVEEATKKRIIKGLGKQ